MVVTLVKGQRICLEKTAGRELATVRMGLGWEVDENDSIDLDASCGMFDARGELVDLVWFAQMRSRDGSVHHTGDSLTGAGEGDDETIVVDLERQPAGVSSLVFTVNSFIGRKFDAVEHAFCRLVDHETGAEVARYEMGAHGRHTALVMARLYRHGGGWKMHALGAKARGRTFQEILPAIEPHL